MSINRPQPITGDQLDNWFSYHSPTAGQPEIYAALRAAGKAFAATIVQLTPPGEDQHAAIRHVRDAVMTGNAAIACGTAQGVNVGKRRGPAIDPQDYEQELEQGPEPCGFKWGGVNHLHVCVTTGEHPANHGAIQHACSCEEHFMSRVSR